jgi:hypothetical protein
MLSVITLDSDYCTLAGSIECIWMSHESEAAELPQDPCTHTCLPCRSFDAHLPDPACTESSDGAEKKTESAGARAEAAPPTPRNTLLAPPERSEMGSLARDGGRAAVHVMCRGAVG